MGRKYNLNLLDLSGNIFKETEETQQEIEKGLRSYVRWQPMGVR